MKRMIQAATAAFFVSAVAFLAGCASTTATSTADKVQAAVAKACPVAKAALPALQALPQLSTQLQADLASVQSEVTVICAQNATVDTSSLQTLVNTSIPALIADVQASEMAAGTKQTIVEALTAADVALQLAAGQ